MSKYINETEFKDFKKNFHVLIDTLNHNISNMNENLTSVKDDVSFMKGSAKVYKKFFWWVLGIIASTCVGLLLILLSIFLQN